MPVMILQALKYWKWVGVGLLLAFSGVQSWRADHWKGKTLLGQETARRVNDAAKRLIAANERFSKASKENARETDKQDTDTRIVWRERVMRIPSAGGQCAAAKDRVPEGVDGPSGDTVRIKRSSMLTCADNTSRLLSAHNWAVKLEELQEAELPAIY